MEMQEKKIGDYIEIVLRRKWILVATVLAGVAIAGAVAATRPDMYTSSTLILVEQQKIPQSYVVATDVTTVQERLGTIRQQIMSRTKLEQIIDEFEMFDEKAAAKRVSTLDRIKKKLGMGDPAAMTRLDMVQYMRAHIDVRVMGGRYGGQAFTIAYTGRDPFKTMQVTSKLASLFIEENLKIKEQYAEGTMEFLENEMKNAKAVLENQEAALRKFRERNMGSLPEQLDANLRTLDRLQLQLDSTGDAIKNAIERKTLLEEQLGVATGSGASRVDPLALELAKLKNDLARLLSVYKENYPDVLITKKKISEVEARMEAASREKGEDVEAGEAPAVSPLAKTSSAYANLSAIQSQIASLKEKEAQLRDQIELYQRRVERTPALEQKLKEIRRDYDISLANYKSLLSKRLNAGLARNMEERQKGERFRVIDPANLPEKPARVKLKKIMMAGPVGGAGVGLGIILLLEFLNPAFRKPEDFEGVVDLPVLATLAHYDLKADGKQAKKFRLIKKTKTGSA